MAKIERRVMSGRRLTITREQRRTGRGRRDDVMPPGAAPPASTPDSRPAPILHKYKDGTLECGNCGKAQDAGTSQGDKCWKCGKAFQEVMESFSREDDQKNKDAPPPPADADPAKRADVTCPECKEVNSAYLDYCKGCGFDLATIGKKGRDDQGAFPADAKPGEQNNGRSKGKSRGRRDDAAPPEVDTPVQRDVAAPNSPGTITGYAAVSYNDTDPGTEYELWQDDMGRAVERIAAGAFEECMSQDDVAGLYNHEPDNLLGRTSAGTLTLAVDGQGLRYEIDLPDTQAGRDVAELVDRGDLNGSSFGFVAEQESWREDVDEQGRMTAVRTLEKVRLLDVGPVTYPAYGATSAGRSRSGIRAVGSVEEARASYSKWKAAGDSKGERRSGYTSHQIALAEAELSTAVAELARVKANNARPAIIEGMESVVKAAQAKVDYYKKNRIPDRGDDVADGDHESKSVPVAATLAMVRARAVAVASAVQVDS